MEPKTIDNLLEKASVLKKAYEECRLSLSEVYAYHKKILSSPIGTPEEFKIEIKGLPKEAYSFKRNIFSSIFQSSYHLLGIEEKKRLLYAKLNYLFRLWVTSADNLLDSEDKILIPIKMPGNSRVMREVISVMSSDRALYHILNKAIKEGVISQDESDIISDKSLEVLLPSAAEEALEEGGITERPDPDYVLNIIHRLKTGLLFQIPFLGPDNIEKNIDMALVKSTKEALGNFGLGCQLLDDIRDMAKDYIEKRHNYVLSKIYWEKRLIDSAKIISMEGDMDSSAKIFHHTPEVACETALLAKDLLEQSLNKLDNIGLGIGKFFIKKIPIFMFDILDVGELRKCLQEGAR